jgi:hypothetical protein
MPQIPLVERRVLPAAGVPGVQLSPEEAAAPFQALAQVGGQITEIGAQISDRMKESEKKASEADYKVRLKRLKSDIADAEVAAITDPVNPMRQQDVYERIYKPAMEDFRKSIEGYDSDIQNKFSFEEESLRESFRNSLRRNIIADHSIKLRESMWQDMIEDTDQSLAEADETFNDLVGLVGLEQAQSWRRRGEYNRELNIINGMKTPEELNAYEIESDDPGHMQALKTQIANRKNAIVAEAKADYLGTTSQIGKAVKEGEVTEQQIAGYEASGGSKKTADNIRRSVELASASDNKRNIKSGYDIVDAFKDTEDPMTMDKAIGKVMGLKLSLSTKSKMVDDIMKAGEVIGSKSTVRNIPTGVLGNLGWKVTEVQTVSGYNSLTEKKAYDEWRDTYTQALALARGEDEYNATIDLMMESRDRLIALGEKYPDGINDEEWAKERKATLGEIGTKIVRQKNAPQVTGQIVGGFGKRKKSYSW